MNYRSVPDLHRLLVSKLSAIGNEYNAVLAIPRSGILLATLLSLHLNVPLKILGAQGLGHGTTRGIRRSDEESRLLVVDDSAMSGRTLARCLESLKLDYPDSSLTTLVAYGTNEASSFVDIILEIVPAPRIFEWNLFHHDFTDQIGFDLDGILCDDPDPSWPWRSDQYLEFIRHTPARVAPTRVLGAVISSRTIDVRSETEDWLSEHRIQYKELHLLSASGDARRAMRLHAEFKAEIYAKSDLLLFVESDPGQAYEIARLTHRPVVCLSPPPRATIPVEVLTFRKRVPPRVRARKALGRFKRSTVRRLGRN